MANHFVDSGTGSDSDNGTIMDLAWATIEHAMEAGGLSTGDFVWIEPGHFEIPISDIDVIYDGAANNFINIVAWPKAAFSITSASWTNGSTTVDLVLPASLTRTGHCGRMVTAPDGFDYFITYVTDSNTFTIDREYAGSTVTLTDGAATIKADPYYAEAQAIDDSAWTIKKTDWDASNPARPIIDFNDAAYQFRIVDDNFIRIQGIEMKDSSDGLGVFRAERAHTYIIGCLFKQTASNTFILHFHRHHTVMEECIVEGSGSGDTQVGIKMGTNNYGGGIGLILKNSAIYNCGDFGIDSSTPIFIDNVNIGVEQANGDDDIECISHIVGKDLKLGGTNGGVYFSNSYGGGYFGIENYQKILGAHRFYFVGGYYERVAVSGETPNKKVSDYILKITPNISGYEFIPEMAMFVLEHEIEVTAAAHTFRYWIYNDSGVTLNDAAATDDIWLEAEYIAGYDDTSEYVQNKIISTQIDILDAAGADDWDYLEVTLTPAVALKARLKIYFSKYLAATNVFVDTAVVIS